jgi:hypothetical protein
MLNGAPIRVCRAASTSSMVPSRPAVASSVPLRVNRIQSTRLSS